MNQIVLDDTIAANVPVQQLLVEMRIQGTYVHAFVRYQMQNCSTAALIKFVS